MSKSLLPVVLVIAAISNANAADKGRVKNPALETNNPLLSYEIRPAGGKENVAWTGEFRFESPASEADLNRLKALVDALGRYGRPGTSENLAFASYGQVRWTRIENVVTATAPTVGMALDEKGNVEAIGIGYPHVTKFSVTGTEGSRTLRIDLSEAIDTNGVGYLIEVLMEELSGSLLKTEKLGSSSYSYVPFRLNLKKSTGGTLVFEQRSR